MKDLSQKELAALLYAKSEATRVAALREITARRDPGSLKALHEALSDTAPSSFFCLLAEAIASFGARDSLPPLRDAFHRTLPDFARVVLLRAIAALDAPEGDGILREAAAGKNEALRLAALAGLSARRAPELSALLIEAFITSSLTEEVATLLREAPDDTIKALALRLMFTESISEEQARAAATIFARRGEASAAPLLRAWASQYGPLRALCKRILRKLRDDGTR